MSVRTIRIGLVTLVLAAATTRAEAQFYGGYGGLWGFENASAATVNALNERSLQAGQAAFASRPTNLTAPRVNFRDDAGLAQFRSYDVATQRAIEQRVSRNRLTPQAPAPPPTSVAAASADSPPPLPSASMTVTLGNFFDRYGSLVWPSEAPTDPALLMLRNDSDLAVAAVRKEYDARGTAAVSSAAEARFKLLEYGRPALDHIRSRSTPAIAEMFHVFLLSLYRNLEFAATVRPAPAVPGGN